MRKLSSILTSAFMVIALAIPGTLATITPASAGARPTVSAQVQHYIECVIWLLTDPAKHAEFCSPPSEIVDPWIANPTGPTPEHGCPTYEYSGFIPAQETTCCDIDTGYVPSTYSSCCRATFEGLPSLMDPNILMVIVPICEDDKVIEGDFELFDEGLPQLLI